MRESSDLTVRQILSETELFANLDNAQLDRTTEICQLITVKKDAVLFEENSSSDEMYIIGQGVIDILIDPSVVNADVEVESVLIAQLRRGDILGEMALVDQGLRSATARASSDECVLVTIRRGPLLELCRDEPALGFTLMHNLAADLALKIRNTDLTLRQYQLELIYRPSD